MSHGPLVVLTRRRGASGWTVHVDPSSVKLGEIVFEANGEEIERKFENDFSVSMTIGEEVVIHDGVSELDVICFRAHEKSAPRRPTPTVMKAIEAVRAADSENARRVLSDVLEESGAVAEAEYVRLELKLQGMRDVQSESFIEGTRQLRALSGVVGPTFRYLVARDIEGCNGVRWAFRCPAAWEQMQTTAKDTERVCTSCRQMVVQVTTEDEAANLAREGVCASVRFREEMWEGEIAEPPEDFDREPQWVGSVAVRPEPIERPPAEPSKKPWWKRIFGG